MGECIVGGLSGNDWVLMEQYTINPTAFNSTSPYGDAFCGTLTDAAYAGYARVKMEITGTVTVKRFDNQYGAGQVASSFLYQYADGPLNVPTSVPISVSGERPIYTEISSGYVSVPILNGRSLTPGYQAPHAINGVSLISNGVHFTAANLVVKIYAK